MRGYLVEVASKKTIIEFSGNVGTSLVGDISDDGRWLVATKILSNKITLWDIKNKKEVRDFPEMPFPVLQELPISVKFSKGDTQVEVRTHKGEAITWDRESGKELSRRNGKVAKPEVKSKSIQKE